jgi:hypothetical protein
VKFFVKRVSADFSSEKHEKWDAGDAIFAKKQQKQ